MTIFPTPSLLLSCGGPGLALVAAVIPFQGLEAGLPCQGSRVAFASSRALRSSFDPVRRSAVSELRRRRQIKLLNRGYREHYRATQPRRPEAILQVRAQEFEAQMADLVAVRSCRGVFCGCQSFFGSKAAVKEA